MIAYNRGSMPEIIDEGVTGFLVSDADSAAAAVESAISSIAARSAAWRNAVSARIA